MKIARALLSVSDKTGLIPLARALAAHGVQLLSTGGTARVLAEAGIPVTDVSDYTGFPEMLDGRVKTLHPLIHGGLLYVRDNPAHRETVAHHGIHPIDLVVVNLYPFEETVRRPDLPLEEAIEQIDIGGPSMLRSAAKNYRSVTVVSDPSDYPEVLAELEENHGSTTLALREKLAIKVFARTAAYDSAISAYLNSRQETVSSFNLTLPLALELRYGENSHQKAALFGSFNDIFHKLHGKELSYNNILDINAASELIEEFTEPTVAILKHTNPCGVGSDPDLREAWMKAYATDKQAPFGGIIVVNRTLTEPLARAIAEIFSEVIIAPDFEPDARALLQKKKNLRLLRKTTLLRDLQPQQDIRSVAGGLLWQEKDTRAKGLKDMETKVVTDRPPTQDEMRAMSFAWKVVKHVKSNAIVFSGPDRTLGIGAGQMSRLDSCRIAVWKAKDAGLSLTGSVMASDAFFPFPDGLLVGAEAGASAVIQPGGSLRDPEVIAAANTHKMAMILSGFRHFKH